MRSQKDETKDRRNFDKRIAEHQTAQDYAIHSNNLAWQIGSILIAGCLILMGTLITSKIPGIYICLGCFLVHLLMVIWLFFFQGEYQIMLLKLHRVRRLEKHLGMKQNYYWDKKVAIYRTNTFSGKSLVVFLVIIICLFSLSFGGLIISKMENALMPIIIYEIIVLILSLLTLLFGLILFLCRDSAFDRYIKLINDK